MDTHQLDQKNDRLWHTAKKRTGFKWSLLCYLIVNIFFVVLWFIGDQSYFWPIWCLFGWGVGLCFQYFRAYHTTGIFSVEREYEKLRKKSNS